MLFYYSSALKFIILFKNRNIKFKKINFVAYFLAILGQIY